MNTRLVFYRCGVRASSSFCLCLGLTAALAQAQPLLRIISPADGAVVEPGDTVAFKVEATGNVTDVFVGGENPLPWSEPRSSPLYEFTIKIPKTVSLRRYYFAALGHLTGKMVTSEKITLDIQRKERPVSTDVQPRTLRLAVGETGYLGVTGTYPDGSISDITEETTTEYLPKSPEVVTVKRDGRVTAVGPGKTQIVINGDCIVQVTVVQPRH